jgi:hypothetical protein
VSVFPPGVREEGGELFETHLSPMNRDESDSARPHAAQETMRCWTLVAYVWSREGISIRQAFAVLAIFRFCFCKNN